ncbi:unnamed protein product, partial [Strongylus vulgaris]
MACSACSGLNENRPKAEPSSFHTDMRHVKLLAAVSAENLSALELVKAFVGAEAAPAALTDAIKEKRWLKTVFQEMEEWLRPPTLFLASVLAAF